MTVPLVSSTLRKTPAMATANPKLVRRCLIVEDDVRLRDAFATLLADHVNEVRACATVSAALACLEEFRPELVVADFALERGTAFDLLDRLETLAPTPVILVISGRAGPEAAFELSERGVRRYVRKPVTPERLLEAVRSALASAPRLEPKLRAAVGTIGLREVEELARRTMIREALAQKRGSRRGAAQLLGISRQLLQYALRSLSD